MSTNTTTSTPKHSSFELYHYDPSLVGAIIFCALFSITSGVHAFQLYRSRTWYFIPLLVGGLMEAIGYVGRILSHFNKEALGPYIMQTLLLLVAPACFAASIYMILGRLIRLVEAEKYSLVRIKWLTGVFVTGDVFSFLLQATGGAIMSGHSESSLHLGEMVVIGGLFMQILFFGFFVITSVVFHYRILRNPTPRSEILSGAATGKKWGARWETLLMMLYITSTFILVRSVFRAIEYIMGNDGLLLRNEVWLYCFDSVLMLAVMGCFNAVHPSRVVPGSGKEEMEIVAMK